MRSTWVAACSGATAIPAHGPTSIAVSSIGFYNGGKFPAWKGNLFLGSLAAQELRRLELTPAGVKQEVLFKNVGRLRDVVMGPDGAIYIAFNQPDRIARIVPASATGTGASGNQAR